MSGIAGQVMLGPICPGPERPDRVCERPYEATIIVLDQQGRVLSQVRSNAAGQFRVPLTPGIYTLRPEAPGRLPRAAEQTVRVESGQFTQVEIRYNTGIR
jgi:hypothetical protein